MSSLYDRLAWVADRRPAGAVDPYEQAVLWVLALHADDRTGACWCSLGLVADITGHGKTRLREAVTRLIAAGIVTTPAGRRGGVNATRYLVPSFIEPSTRVVGSDSKPTTNPPGTHHEPTTNPPRTVNPCGGEPEQEPEPEPERGAGAPAAGAAISLSRLFEDKKIQEAAAAKGMDEATLDACLTKFLQHYSGETFALRTWLAKGRQWVSNERVNGSGYSARRTAAMGIENWLASQGGDGRTIEGQAERITVTLPAWADEEGWQALARQLGVDPPQEGERQSDFRERVRNAAKAKERGQ